MIYTPLTNKAMKIAYKAHQNMVDKAGIPYVFHPFHLAEQMDDEISVCVALLHDVVEDSQVTFEDLEKEFPKEIIEALRYLTFDKSVSYFDYIRNIKNNSIAIKVKLADLEHNSDVTRFLGEDIDQKKLDYFKNKYSKAKEILLEK